MAAAQVSYLPKFVSKSKLLIGSTPTSQYHG
jgi:hypothetical protein